MSSERDSKEKPATIWAALCWAVEELKGAGGESPRLDAEVLLSHVLGWTRTRILAHLHDPLARGVWQGFRDLVRRSAAGEPLQYVTGEREFYGLLFKVTPAALIPRPETEILVEKAVDLVRDWAETVRFLDVGTGSGCIAVALAHELPRASGWATDISLEALKLARENAVRLGAGERLKYLCCDLLESFQPRPLFDLVLSNPPYIPGAQLGELPRTIRDYEPHQALFGGESGIDAYRLLIPQAVSRLAPEGHLLLEVGDEQADEVAGLVEREALTMVEIIKDLQGIPRCLVARRKAPRKV